MTILEFIDDDGGYRDWLNKNPRGYVINIQRSFNPSDARLHRANCTDLLVQLERDVQLAVSYVKVCGEAEAEVNQWAAKKVGKPIKRCEHCDEVAPRLCRTCRVELPATGRCPAKPVSCAITGRPDAR